MTDKTSMVGRTRLPGSPQRQLERTLLGLAVVIAGLCSASCDDVLETFDVSCTRPGIPAWTVRWAKLATLEPTFRVEAISLSGQGNDGSGWLLAHRPPASEPDSRYALDVIVENAAVIGMPLADSLIPRAIIGPYKPIRLEPTATLTCPGGNCQVSPHWGCRETYIGDERGRKVAVTGDSLIGHDTFCDICSACAGDKECLRKCCDTTLRYWLASNGEQRFIWQVAAQTFVSMLDLARSQAATRPDVHVLALGTNDAREQADAQPEEQDARRQATVRSASSAIQAVWNLNPNACVVLVTASRKYHDNNMTFAEYRTEADRVNAVLRYMSADPRVRLADWAAASEAYCGSTWLTNPYVTCELFAADHLHLSARGVEERAAVMVSAVQSCSR